MLADIAGGLVVVAIMLIWVRAALWLIARPERGRHNRVIDGPAAHSPRAIERPRPPRPTWGLLYFDAVQTDNLLREAEVILPTQLALMG